MPGLFYRKILFPGIAGLIAASSSFFTNEARADQPADTSPPGAIIFSRDVYYRSAIGPSVPGEAHSVDISPDVNVTAMIGQGLKPLTDSETATLTAPLGSIGASVGDTMQGSPVALALSQSQRSFDLGKHAGGGSASGGIVGQAMSVLPAALDSMRGALGAGR